MFRCIPNCCELNERECESRLIRAHYRNDDDDDNDGDDNEGAAQNSKCWKSASKKRKNKTYRSIK